MSEENVMEGLTNDALGQMWASKLVWYLMEMKEGKALLADETHTRLVAELKQIDDELDRRGLPVDRRYTAAFEHRELLPSDDMRRLSIQAYGREMKFVGLPAEES